MMALGRKTGPKPRFHIEDVVNTALSLGLDTFTLSDVARTLKVSTPSLYRVVATREELVHLCLKKVAKELRIPPPTTPWQDQLRFYVDEIWEIAERYPGTVKAIVNTPGAHVHVQQFFRDFSASLSNAGFPGDAQLIDFALDFLGDTTFMTHLQISTYRSANATDGLQHVKELLHKEAEQSGEATHFPFDESWTQRGFLDQKVEFIIKGMEAKLLHPNA
ncbi:MAG: TetR/AcrR family transcriptional regulator [Corynebacterium sp.]|nr:TetR/AcrR family transcriptional regulator [Corynebacterium sp.]